MLPVIVMRPILLLPFSTNHSAPSDPATIAPRGLRDWGIGTGNSPVMTPLVVIRQIVPAASVNHGGTR